MWDRTKLHNIECVLVETSTLHDTDYVLVGQEYIAQYRLCTCGTGVHCTIQTMYLWNTKTRHNTDYVLLGQEYTAQYRLCTCGTLRHCTMQTCTCGTEYIAQCGTRLHWTIQNVFLLEQVHCTKQTMYLWDTGTLNHTDYVLVGQEYTDITMYLWDRSTTYHTDYVLVGH